MDKIIMDRSELAQWGTCPHQARLCLEKQYPCNDRLPVGGVLGHELIEKCFNMHRISPPDAAPVYDLAKVAESVIDELPKLRPDLSQEVIKSCKYLADTIADLANIPIVGVEMQVEAEITPEEMLEKIGYKTDKTAVITQCLDLVQYGRNSNSLHYRDWKTGYKKRTQAEAQDEFQSACGAWLLLRNYDGTRATADGEFLPKIDTVHVWYHEVRWRTSAYARFDRTYEENPEQPHLTTFRKIENRVLKAVKMWLEGCDEAWPEPTKCGLCPAVHDCKHADYEIKMVADDPEGAVDALVVWAQKAKALEEALKKYHRGHGRIEGTCVAFDWKPSPRYRPKLMPLKGETGEDE